MQLLTVLLSTTIWSACQLAHAAPQNAEAAAALIEPEFIGVQAVDTAVTADKSAAPPEADYQFSSLGQMEARYRKYVKDALAGRPRNAKCNSKNVVLRKYW